MKSKELLQLLAQELVLDEDLIKLCQSWGLKPIYGSIPCSGQWIKTVHRDMTIQRLAQYALDKMADEERIHMTMRWEAKE